MEWLSGKKTIIGSSILLAAVAIDQVVLGVWHIDEWWVPKVMDSLDWAGMIITGGGLSHKLVKARAAKNGGG